MNSFSLWLNERFLDWQKERGGRKTIVEWADWLGVEQPTLSRWLNGSSRPRGASIMRLGLIYGDEVYAVLDIKKSKRDDRLRAINEWWMGLPEEIRSAIFSTAQRGKAITALRERNEGKPSGRKTKKTK